jgi:zinc D-Ala-D-Ala dipeptidase
MAFIRKPRLLAGGVLLLAAVAGKGAAAQGLPAGFVFLHDVDPSIRQDIKYASAENFVGRKLPGYESAECVLQRPVAEALKKAQAALAPEGLSMIVYDCYRPARAVRAMARWAADGGEATKSFYPRVAKSQLFAQGYIARTSGHSAGTVVDIGLVKLVPAGTSAPKERSGPCTETPGEDEGSGVDMGTSFDCFDVKSHTFTPAITKEQRQRRSTLIGVMQRHGFQNYAREWWHFSYGGGRKAQYDFPITRPAAPQEITPEPSEKSD